MSFTCQRESRNWKQKTEKWIDQELKGVGRSTSSSIHKE